MKLRKFIVTNLIMMLAWTAEPSWAQELTGWARLGAGIYSRGPTSGLFVKPNAFGTYAPPYFNKQPVEGFSGIIPAHHPDVYYFISDNGFGSQNNSADFILRTYCIYASWRTHHGGLGKLLPARCRDGEKQKKFNRHTWIGMQDIQQRLTLPIQADYPNYLVLT
jgi:hypothetical protein